MDGLVGRPIYCGRRAKKPKSNARRGGSQQKIGTFRQSLQLGLVNTPGQFGRTGSGDVSARGPGSITWRIWVCRPINKDGENSVCKTSAIRGTSERCVCLRCCPTIGNEHHPRDAASEPAGVPLYQPDTIMIESRLRGAAPDLEHGSLRCAHSTDHRTPPAAPQTERSGRHGRSRTRSCRHPSGQA